MGHFKKGIYKLVHPEKYMLPNPPVYRSSWEQRICYYMDHNTNVIKWASEPFKIKYFLPTDGKWHKYTPDFYCEINTNQGIKIQLIEVKPKQQSKPPKPPKKKTAKSLRNFKALQLTVFKNQQKWEAAELLCKQKGWDWKIITEEHIFNKGKK